jgi:uncharacterized protein YndB with AHSA1/START domain
MAEARIDGRAGGRVELWLGPSRFHVTGAILDWTPPTVFEHEWKVDPPGELPEGEDAVIRWELRPEGSGTRLTLTFRDLTRPTALGFAPGRHSYLDRLDAKLADRPLSDWAAPYAEVRPHFPAWTRPVPS